MDCVTLCNFEMYTYAYKQERVKQLGHEGFANFICVVVTGWTFFTSL